MQLCPLCMQCKQSPAHDQASRLWKASRCDMELVPEQMCETTRAAELRIPVPRQGFLPREEDPAWLSWRSRWWTPSRSPGDTWPTWLSSFCPADRASIPCRAWGRRAPRWCCTRSSRPGRRAAGRPGICRRTTARWRRAPRSGGSADREPWTSHLGPGRAVQRRRASRWSKIRSTSLARSGHPLPELRHREAATTEDPPPRCPENHERGAGHCGPSSVWLKNQLAGDEWARPCSIWFLLLLGCTHGARTASEQGRRVYSSTPPSLSLAENLLVASHAVKWSVYLWACFLKGKK